MPPPITAPLSTPQKGVGIKFYLYALAAAALFSTGGAAIKSVAFSGWQVAGLRSLMAALFLAAVFPQARHLADPKPWAVGCFYAATLTTFVIANKLTTAANAILLQSTAPLYLLAAGPLLLGERLRRHDIAQVAAVAVAMALFFAGREPATAIALDPLQGNLLAALSGISWAATLAGLRWMARTGSGSAPIATVLAGNLLVAAAGLLLGWPIPSGDLTAWLIILYLGVFQVGLAYWFLNRSIRHLPALEASLFMLLEPILNPVWTWIVHGERPNNHAFTSGVILVSALAGRAWLEWRAPERRELRQRNG